MVANGLHPYCQRTSRNEIGVSEAACLHRQMHNQWVRSRRHLPTVNPICFKMTGASPMRLRNLP